MFRDDAEAALYRADELEKELARAKEEHAQDLEKIAALEAQLAEARRQSREKRPVEKPRDREVKRSPAAVFVGLAVVMLVGAGGAFYALMGSPPRATPRDLPTLMTHAWQLARAEASDAELYGLRLDYVDATGQAHFEYGGHVSFRFRSPSRAHAPAAPSRPLGAPAVQPSLKCQLRVYGDQRRDLHTDWSSTSDCGVSLPGPLRCSVTDVWGRAIAKGAPADALAEIRLDTDGAPPRRTWRVIITDHNKSATVFSKSFDDDC